MSLYPILEFDDNDDVYIKPHVRVDGLVPIENLVITFFKEVLNTLIETAQVEPYIHFKGENDYTFYKFKDEPTVIFHGGIGGPLCGGMMEEAIAMGVKKILFCGGGGTLLKLPVGHCIVIDSAIRDEGMSYHYVKASREIQVNPAIVQMIDQKLSEEGIPHIIGKAWTTDAFYRETKTRVERRKREGAAVVEMEQAGLIAVAQFRKVKYGAIVYAGDDLTNDTWDSRKWQSRTSIRMALVQFCRDTVKSM